MQQTYYILFDTSLPLEIRFWLFDWLENFNEEATDLGFQVEFEIFGYTKDSGYSAIKETFRIFEPKNANIFLLSDSDNCDLSTLLGQWGCPLVNTLHNPIETNAIAELLQKNSTSFFPIVNSRYRDTKADYLDLANLTGGESYELSEINNRLIDGLIVADQLALLQRKTAAVPDPSSVVALLVFLGFLLFVRKRDGNRVRRTTPARSRIAKGLRKFCERLGGIGTQATQSHLEQR